MDTKEMFVVKFDYNIAVLTKIAEETQSINKSDIEEVSNKVKELVKMRRAIEAQGKSFRDEANAYNKRVISEEKTYIEILLPIEEEFKTLIENEKQRQVIEARKELLPLKKQQLSLLKIIPVRDEEILQMGDEQWVEYYNGVFVKHQEQLEYEERSIREEKERQEREIVIRKEEEEKKRQEEVKQEQEKAKLEANKKYQDFLLVNNFNKETDIIQNNKIYRLVATFNQ